MNSFAERIMRLKPVTQAYRQPLDYGHLGCEAPVADQRGEACGLLEQALNAFNEACKNGPQRWRGMRAAQLFYFHTGVERNVDSIELPVILGAVLQVIDDLECGAQRIVGGPGRAAFPMDVEHEPADRHCRQPAIADQVIPSLVSRYGDVPDEGVEQLM